MKLCALFSIKNLELFIEAASDHYNLRKLLLELLNLLHVDFKDGLLNDRNKYYTEKPIDL